MKCHVPRILSASYLFFFFHINCINLAPHHLRRDRTIQHNNFFTFLRTRNHFQRLVQRKMEEIKNVSDIFRFDVRCLRANISHCFRTTPVDTNILHRELSSFFFLSALENNLTRISHLFSTTMRKIAGAISQKPIAPNNYVILD